MTIEFNPYALFFLAIPIVLFLLARKSKDPRAVKLLEAWAQENDYQIIKYENRRFFMGPFLGKTSRNQPVYRVFIMDTQGELGIAWVRLGSWWFGTIENRVSVIWEKSPHP